MPIKHNGSRLEEVYSFMDFEKAIYKIDGMVTPGQIADKLGCNARYAREKLKGYVEQDRIRGKKIADRWVFWL
jgi:hypothetical protein